MRLICAIFALSLLMPGRSDDTWTETKDLLYGGDTPIKLLNRDTYREFVDRNYSVVYFGTAGCKTCFQVEHELLLVAEDLEWAKGNIPKDQYKGHHRTDKGLAAHAHELDIGLVNIKEFPDIAKELKVGKIPTLRVYHKGLWRKIPDSLFSKYGIETVVHQRIHLKRLPTIHSQERLIEVLSNVPHALLLTIDGGHKLDHQAKHMFRNLQFSLSHFHFYVVDDMKTIREFNLSPHELYEINAGTKIFKHIPYKDLMINGTVDASHFEELKRRVYDAAHQKVQMADLAFYEKHGLEDNLIFYSTDTDYASLSSNQKLSVFNHTCGHKLYHHTRCAVLNFELLKDITMYDHIYHVKRSRLESNMVIHFVHHAQGYKREAFLLHENEYSSEGDLVQFYNQSLTHQVPVFVEMSEPVPDNNGKKIHKIVGSEVWKYWDSTKDLLIYSYNSNELNAERFALVGSLLIPRK